MVGWTEAALVVMMVVDSEGTMASLKVETMVE
jgi:hypothetical protein